MTQISIHAPLRERLPYGKPADSVYRFQSTLPCGSDPLSICYFYSAHYFNPRSLAGATFMRLCCSLCDKISIHAPLRERQYFKRFWLMYPNFNPRSLAGATVFHYRCHNIIVISIHAPLRERPLAAPPCAATRHFNPRSLAGATEAG